ncbi:MAG TPA: porin, partial [Planctomycetota bacterium]|nr:porin [Planctomycetota bacterium]
MIRKLLSVLVALFVATTALHAAVSDAEFDAMKQEMQEMRKKMNGMEQNAMPVMSDVDHALAAQCLTNECATSAVGKLKIGGLVQVWYYAIERDTQGLFSSPGNGVVDHNIAVSQNSFAIRRAELNFTMDIHEYVTAYVMGDLARESDIFRGTFAQLGGGNQGFVKTGLDNKVGAPLGAAPAILQDAVINLHGVIPHHDITVGQMLPYFSQEDFNPNGWLDFVERSWIGNFYPRDDGAVL